MTLPDAIAHAKPYVTPASWGDSQRAHTAELLVEQAHLEKKAAACAMSFLFRVPGGAEVQRALSALAREELVHFERTLRLLAARGIPFTAQPPSAYAARLKAGIATSMPERLVDELLVAARIEARSHERMGLLAAALQQDDAELADFYRDLCEAEARHEELYGELARRVVAPDLAAQREAALWVHEADVLRALPWAPRLHGGLPEGHRG